MSKENIARIWFGEYYGFRPSYPLDRIGMAGCGSAPLINVDYPDLLNNFREHLDPNRSESASFLIWYLEKYYRLDMQEAVDAICDQGNDKGVDGIFINENDQTITIFQSKISHKSNSSIGDAPLRELAGTLQQFSSKERVENLVKTAGNAQVASLIKRTDLLNKLSGHEVRGEFLINLDLDKNGEGFLDGHENISFFGKSDLVSQYISSERAIKEHPTAIFDVLGIDVAQHVVDIDHRAVIAPIRAKELVALEGIADQSLFDFNVRGPLGKTKVNKDMKKSIVDKGKHKSFPLFHNGITVITRRIEITPELIKIDGYHVVNGCQSITTLFDNKTSITDDLRILTKFVQLDPMSAEAKMITEYSNNQNAVKSRDFKSNHQIQIRLQSEFRKFYKDVYSYEIKRGDADEPGESISNEDAGLYLTAFDLKEPWTTHRRYEIFEDKHSRLFGKPEVTADRIVLIKLIDAEIKKRLPLLENQLVAKHLLTEFMLLFVVREYFSDDETFNSIVSAPEKYMRIAAGRNQFSRTIGSFIDEIIIDLNMESKEFPEDFDYRDKLRDAEWTKSLSKSLVREFLKQKTRGKAPTFKAVWESNVACEGL